MTENAAQPAPGSMAVVIRTRDRPERLGLCLEALERAYQRFRFEVWVGDSSTSAELRSDVAAACDRYDYVHLRHHEGVGFGPAHNFCASIAAAELLVNVDDDVYVQEDAIEKLVDAYRRATGWRVVAGSVAWGDSWSAPVVMRRIGFGRKARPNEGPSFLVTALFAYPRALALACPWIETVPTSDDRMIGALWRAKGVRMLFAPDARAVHDPRHSSYGVQSYGDHIYANLFDALIANRSLRRACAYEVLGFLAAVRPYLRRPRRVWQFLAAWWRGHRQLFRDWSTLTATASAPLPPWAGD
jgi:glycosyltransferase involved in cell wall biosynthesis